MELKDDNAGAPSGTIKFKIVNYLLGLFFILGLTLTVFEINLYRETLIPWSIPAAIWIISGYAAALITSRLLKTHLKLRSFAWQLVFSIGAFGGLFAYGFIALNYYFPAGEKAEIINTPILKAGYLPKGKNSCGSPYAHVLINGFGKELIFPCDVVIENYTSVNLSLKKGFFGFYVIADKEAVIK